MSHYSDYFVPDRPTCLQCCFEKAACICGYEGMTPKQYIHAIAALGLSQRAAGAFLGVDERTSRRWVSGDSAIPESAAKLLRLMIRLKIDPAKVE